MVWCDSLESCPEAILDQCRCSSGTPSVSDRITEQRRVLLVHPSCGEWVIAMHAPFISIQFNYNIIFRYAYSSVERTLCPLFNIDPDHPGNTAMVELELSTSSPTSITVQLSSTYFDEFYHR